MRTYLFERARKILLNNWVERRAVTDQNMYFEVRNESGRVFNVTIGYNAKKGQNYQMDYSCDCDFMGTAGTKHGLLCSHIIACMGWLMGLRSKEQTCQETTESFVPKISTPDKVQVYSSTIK